MRVNSNHQLLVHGHWIAAVLIIVMMMAEGASAQNRGAEPPTLSKRLSIGGQIFDLIEPRTEIQRDIRLSADAIRRAGIADGPPAVSPRALGAPILFEHNQGQGAKEAFFVTRGSRYASALLADGFAVAVFRDQDAARTPRPIAIDRDLTNVVPRRVLRGGRPVTALRQDAALTGNRIRFQLVDAKPVTPVGKGKLRANIRQIIGQDKKRWLNKITGYQRVEYRQPYPGVDMIVHGADGQLQHSFHLGPGADHKQILVRVDGAETLEIDKAGNLIIHTSGGPVVQTAPVAAEQSNGKPRQLRAGYVLVSDDTYAFDIKGRTPGARLVIDPVLVFQTYYGGSEHDADFIFPINGIGLIRDGFTIAFGPSGHVFIVGATASPDFPVTGDSALNGETDAFVLRIEPQAAPEDRVVYATYIGGERGERGRGITALADGTTYFTGFSGSSDFPVSDDAIHTSPNQSAAYVASLDPTGAFAAGTYLGSNGDTLPNAITHVPEDGSVIVGGTVRDQSIINSDATDSAFQTDYAGGRFDGFVARIDGALSAYHYFTFLGGSGRDGVIDVAQRQGQAYVVGNTTSTDFPVTAFALQTQHSQAGAEIDCTEEDSLTLVACAEIFVTRLGPDGALLAFSTYLGDTNQDYALGIALTESGQPAITGARRQSASDVSTIFATKLESGGGAILDTLAIDGVDRDHGASIAIDGAGRAHIAGTVSIDGLTTGQGAEGYKDEEDMFYARLNDDWQIDYFTYLGGSATDYGFAVATEETDDGTTCAVIAGATVSADVTAVNAIQDQIAGTQSDLLLSEICDIPPSIGIPDGNFFKQVASPVVQEGETITFTVTVVNESDFDVPARLTDTVPASLTVTNLFGTGCTRIGNAVTCDNGFVLRPGGNIVTIQAVADSCGFTTTNIATLELGGGAVSLETDPVNVTVTCPPEPVGPFCGDGTVDDNEDCDWNSPDGASCRPDCTLAVCGDGTVDTFIGETCDDANTSNTDRCNTNCQVIPSNCVDNPSACIGGLVCGKSCGYVDETICIGVPLPGGGCFGVPVGDEYYLCDAEATCMAPALADEVFN